MHVFADRFPLTQLPLGQAARVERADVGVHDGAYLRALGLRPEACVRMCRLGEPCIIEVFSGATGGCCRIGLAASIAMNVIVSPLDAGGLAHAAQRR